MCFFVRTQNFSLNNFKQSKISQNKNWNSTSNKTSFQNKIVKEASRIMNKSLAHLTFHGKSPGLTTITSTSFKLVLNQCMRFRTPPSSIRILNDRGKPKIFAYSLDPRFSILYCVFSMFNIIIYFKTESNTTNSYLLLTCNLNLMSFNKNSASMHYKVQRVRIAPINIILTLRE